MTYQRESEKKLKVAIVGVGSHCYRNILPALNYLPVELIALCDINEDLVKATAKQYGNCAYYTRANEMYESECLDAVLMSISPYDHPKLAIEAFDAGVHVWMEKPAAVRAYEVEEMIQYRKEKVAVVGYKKLFMPSLNKVFEILHSPEFDELTSMLAVYPMTMPANGAIVLQDRRYENWLANGCHPLSLLLAVGGKVSGVTTHIGASGVGCVMIDFANGVTANFHLATGPQPIESYRFFGGNWHLEIDNCSKVTLQRGIPLEYGVTTSYVAEGMDSGAIVWEPQNCLATLENKALFTQGIYGELHYFCECIIENKQAVKGSLEFTLELMKVYEAALLSGGKTIYLQ